jgi:hypothetical protein
MFRTCLPAGRYKENLVNRVNPVKKVPRHVGAKFLWDLQQFFFTLLEYSLQMHRDHI